MIRKGGDETIMAICGGFLEVRPDRVIILTDAAERCEEIDLVRAEEAKLRAQELLGRREPEVDVTRAEAALRRSLVRLKVGEQRRKRNQGYKTG
jgi:F-type H+-transporting ATPase subunit epsilon